MKIQCDVCEKAPATVICCADEAALCAKCDVEVHAANKLASKHQRLLLQCHSNKLPRCDICQVIEFLTFLYFIIFFFSILIIVDSSIPYLLQIYWQIEFIGLFAWCLQFLIACMKHQNLQFEALDLSRCFSKYCTFFHLNFFAGRYVC